MAEESFASAEIADILNANFICIKVGREELPDIDHIYMTATQTMTGGGWPMSVFLFADKKPFYAGTYFPSERRHNHPGLGELLHALSQAWTDNRDTLAGSAERITSFLQGTPTDSIDSAWSNSAVLSFIDIYDSEYHGFGDNNKFPRPSCVTFLHYHSCRTSQSQLLEEGNDTLVAMGGMFDHIGGGFHHYSVDRQWRIPHFEKMLYDHTQLVASCVTMYQHTGSIYFAKVAAQTIEYVLRDTAS